MTRKEKLANALRDYLTAYQHLTDEALAHGGITKAWQGEHVQRAFGRLVSAAGSASAAVAAIKAARQGFTS